MKREAVLIVKLGALGDLILATPAIRQILSAEGGSTVWILTTPGFATLFAHWPGLRVQTMERKGFGAFRGALSWVRTQGFRRVYDLQCNDRSRLLCTLSGIPERVGNAPQFPYTHHPPVRGRGHPYGRLNELLEAAGIGPAGPEPWLPVTAEEARKVEEWIDRQALRARPFALLHAGASARWGTKRWPYYGELAEALSRAGIEAVWIGAGEDAAANRALAMRVGIDASAAFSVPELRELGRHARFAVTNDSGPMHILSGAGIPVYAFFGPTDWQRSHAIGQVEHVLTLGLACSPCHLAECPPRHAHACMRDLTVARVLARLESDGLLRPPVEGATRRAQ